MPWMIVIHISALIFWCSLLLFLPRVIAYIALPAKGIENQNFVALPRKLFTLVLSPAALLAIISGSILFFEQRTVAFWLIAKLTFVSGLVICHVLNGWLILKMDEMSERFIRQCCITLSFISALLMITIVWLVLAKPVYG